MSWQKKARGAIAVFLVIFVAVVIVALRRRGPAVVDPVIPKRQDPKSLAEAHGGGELKSYNGAKLAYSLTFEDQLTYPDGRTVQRRVTLKLPDKNGRVLVVTADEGERTAKPGQQIGTVHLKGNVKLTTSDGAVITTNDATFDDETGLLQVPGQVGFTRGRMKGTGIGATYDRNRDVLWLLDKAQISVAPDPKGGGALEASSGSAGLARADHYVKLTKNAHVTADGRIIDADDITVMLTADDERVQMLQLRGNSRMTGSKTEAGPQAMSARDIDLTYGDDGRTLQHAQLMENSVLQLPGEGKSPGRRIAARTIDIAMAPDGATVTNLNATEAVQVDLPAEGDIPAKRIRSATLTATGAPGTGLQNFVFGGNVDYRETRAARGALAAVDRTARASSLNVHTKPGFGAPDEADFHGNVHITDGPQVVADAPRALYHVTRDQIDLSPGEGDVGIGPRLADGRVTIEARTINFGVGTRKLKAETKVRGVMRPQPKEAPGRAGAAPPTPAAGGGGRIPSMLAQDKPVNVTSNQLDYDGGAGHAVYEGNARLWQDDTSVAADTIVVDDKTGNLEARSRVRTEMMLDEVDSKTGQRTPTRTNGTAETFLYDDAKRLATYTTDAHLIGSEGDVTAEKLELFLKPGANELERVEGYGKEGTVIVKESARTATGARLTYTTKDETYLMTGRPVVVIETAPTGCKRSEGTRLTFQKSVDTTSMSADGDRILAKNIPCPPGVK